MIKGKKIVLRGVEDTDIEFMTRWRNDRETNKHFFVQEPTTVDRQRKWIGVHRKRDDERLFIIAPIDNPSKAVGTVGLVDIDQRNRRAEWGRFLIGDASARRAGFGSEALYLSLRYAFRVLKLQRLYLEVFSWNRGARSLYRRFGFKFEGTCRSHVFSDGHFHDISLYGLLRSEFLQNEKRIRKKLYKREGQ
jgi:diamine N-acetyltransferase